MAERRGLCGCGCTLLLLIVIGVAAFYFGTRYGKKVEHRVDSDVKRVQKAADAEVNRLNDNLKQTEAALDSLSNDGGNAKAKKKNKPKSSGGKHDDMGVDFTL